MTPIVAGRFEQDTDVQHAIEALRENGFAPDDVTSFFVNPPGQHGDHEASPGAAHAHAGALKGAVVGAAVGLGVGLAAAPVMGPAAAVVAASAGAYAGSLAGALDETEERPTAPPAIEVVEPVRSAGLVVAVRAPEYAKRVAAANVLRAAGARDIERADGTWQAGQWVDFNPLKPPLLVDLPGSEADASRR